MKKTFDKVSQQQPDARQAEIQLVNHEPLPVPLPPRSPFHLSEDQIRFFDENGYLVLRQWITGDLLERLQASGDRWIERGETLRARQLAGEPLKPDDADLLNDLAFAKRPGAEVFFRVNYLHNKGETSSLELLGSPQVLAVAESLCGEDFVPTYESMVFKKAGDGEKIPWHQDAVHTRKHRVFNFDLYLDTSKIGGGALRVVPKSQRAIQDACGVAEAFAWDIPGVIHVELEPGDVLLHDVMVLHGSERTLGAALRRTIYYEFRSSDMISEEGPWDAEWMKKRLQLVPAALECFAARYSEHAQFQWNVSASLRPAPSAAELALKIAHEQHSPGAYCSATSAPREVVERAMARLEAADRL
jgi:ectoine hydroxylase-related dioxygenase (phytanoyl-CoA dioxygenase family)